MLIEIKNRWDNSIIIAGEYESIKDCLEKNSYANLRSADLRSANLRSANLRSADLRSADLRSANLSSANLRSANLRSADLRSADLSSANLRSADLRSANLSSANLRSANLSYANLRYANLRSADLSSANLSYADLSYADLSSADLSSANLSYAKNINKYLTTPLMSLYDQVGKIRLYKLVTKDYSSPTSPGLGYSSLTYNIKDILEVLNADSNDFEQCSRGISVATLDWCIKNWQPTYRILIVEFTASDIACVPIATDGKIRLYRCKVIKEVDLKKIGVE
jgi:hypothetical protein